MGDPKAANAELWPRLQGDKSSCKALEKSLMARSREYGGRKKTGDRRQAREDAKALALPYVSVAMKTLVQICRTGDSDASRVSAAKAILDRAYGKPVQAIANDSENPFELGVPDEVKSLLDSLATKISIGDGKA